MSMQIINISSKSILQLQQQFTLIPGQLLKGQIAEVQGNQVLLQLSGGVLCAETKVRLKTGQKLNLIVESVKNGNISLKVLANDQKIRPGNLLLMRMGIKPQEEIEKVLREFLRFQLPLNPHDIREISKFSQENDLSLEMIQLLVWLRSVGLKISSNEDVLALEQLYSFFKGELTEKSENRFFEFISRLENTSAGGYQISGCSIGCAHIYFLTSDSGHLNLHPEMHYIIMKLKSQVLAELWVKIKSANKKLNIHILCAGQKGFSLLHEEIGQLEKALTSAGYYLEGLVIEKGRADTIFAFIPEQSPGITGIDVTV